MALQGGEIKKTVLCFVVNREAKRLLMIEKKRGQGEGKWNVPGGKVKPGETEEAAAIRETEEETGYRPGRLKKRGALEFYFPESDSWDNTCTVFYTEDFSGCLGPENEECSTHWVPLDKIPFAKMWDDDHLWIPLVFAGKPFHRAYTFDAKDQMKSEVIKDPA